MSKQETSRDGFGFEIPAPLDAAVDRTAAALKQEGCGFLSMVDVRAAMGKQLGGGFEPYVVLGASNPLLGPILPRLPSGPADPEVAVTRTHGPE